MWWWWRGGDSLDSATSCRTLFVTTLPRNSSIEEKGHDVHRSIDGIHDTISQRIAHTPPSAAPAVSPTDDTEIAPPPRGNSRQQSGKSGCRGTAADWGGGGIHGRCLALRDYYPFWRENLEAARAGKLLPVDLSENPKVGGLRKKFKIVSCMI